MSTFKRPNPDRLVKMEELYRSQAKVLRRMEVIVNRHDADYWDEVTKTVEEGKAKLDEELNANYRKMTESDFKINRAKRETMGMFVALPKNYEAGLEQLTKEHAKLHTAITEYKGRLKAQQRGG